MTVLSSFVSLPPWADEVRRRYLRGEASQFVLYGNIHDVVLLPKQEPNQEPFLRLSEFLVRVLLDKKNIILIYNVSTGAKVMKGKLPPGYEELLIHKEPSVVLPLLERLLITSPGVALLVEYADTVTPMAETSFSTSEDRASVVTLQRWSMLQAIDRNDSVILLLVENLSELHPKLVGNPRVATVQVPMPNQADRRSLVTAFSTKMTTEDVEQLVEVTAGLKLVQIKGILAPESVESDNDEERTKYIIELLGGENAAKERASKLSEITRGMSKDEIRKLIAPEGPNPASGNRDAQNQMLTLIGARKREIIERECFGLIEFVEPKHGFDVVGGMDEVKKDLLSIAHNIQEGHRNRVPMGVLFTGPMGTGKTFVAEAFAKESGLTAIKLKNFRSKWVGATESNLERILQVIKAMGQVMVIIDEGDRAFGNQGEDDGGTGSRVIARLKEFMSDTSNRGRILFVVMTNRPDKLDIDLKRAGRLDRKIPFFYAQSVSEVQTIVEAQLRKNRISHQISLDGVQSSLDPLVGISNADIEAVVLLANEYANREQQVSLNQTGQNSADSKVLLQHLEQAMHDYLPSRDTEMLEFMELLAVFEASNRRLLPPKYADVPIEELQNRFQRLKATVGFRR